MDLFFFLGSNAMGVFRMPNQAAGRGSDFFQLSGMHISLGRNFLGDLSSPQSSEL